MGTSTNLTNRPARNRIGRAGLRVLAPTAAALLAAGCCCSTSGPAPKGAREPQAMADVRPDAPAAPAPKTATAGAHGTDAHGAGDPGAVAGPSADEAAAMLMTGNGRYVAEKLARPHQSAFRRGEVAQGQHPFAVVLCCSDSRVPPEIVFDAGLGDLFVVRVAGNTADDAALGSIEYAVEHLGPKLIFVLGHERCGAVKAAVDSVTQGGDLPGHLAAVVDPIKPLAARAKEAGGDVLDGAVSANVAAVVERIRDDKPFAGRLKSGQLKVVGGRYDLDTGAVELVK